MATILAHSIKPIVTSLSNGDNVRELLTIVKNLFRKGKTTNLTIIVTNDLKQIKKTLRGGIDIEATITQIATQALKGYKCT